MITLHIEAETFKELHALAIAALYHAMPQPDECGVEDDVPPAPAIPKAKAPRTPKATPVPKAAADGLQATFERLVERDYDSALSILDALGVANFKEAITGGMGEQIRLAMEAFPE
jgi:hypothetical protein